MKLGALSRYVQRSEQFGLFIWLLLLLPRVGTTPWVGGWVGGWLVGWVGGRLGGRVVGWVGGWLGGWVGAMVGWVGAMVGWVGAMVGWVVGWGRCPIHRPEVNAERASCYYYNIACSQKGFSAGNCCGASEPEASERSSSLICAERGF